MLNTRRRPIRIEQVSQGLLDTILVHPREVFQSAIATRAAAIVLVHNHPSGDPTPSEADTRPRCTAIHPAIMGKMDSCSVFRACVLLDTRIERRQLPF
jgi:proteasome lid subunit RPN8/RPN11